MLIGDFSLGVQSIVGEGGVWNRCSHPSPYWGSRHQVHTAAQLPSLYIKDRSQGEVPPTVCRPSHTNQNNNSNPPQACTQSRLPLTFRINHYTFFNLIFVTSEWFNNNYTWNPYCCNVPYILLSSPNSSLSHICAYLCIHTHMYLHANKEPSALQTTMSHLSLF